MGVKSLIFSALICFSIVYAIPAMSENGNFLGDRHQKEFSVECSGCHLENPPAKAPDEGLCTGCHGSLEEIGKNTELKDLPNPHNNHNDELYCSDCHNAHKPATNFCSECHDFAYKIP